MPLGDEYYVIPRVVYKTSNPTIIDDNTKGMEVGQFWQNTTTKDIFCCIDNTTGAARWYTSVFQVDPLEATVPDFQVEIDNAVTNKNWFITPEVIFSNSDIIDYDLSIPGTALSLGPITIEVGHTVTVDGIWTII